MQYVTRYSRKSLRVLGSVGEPINPSAWRLSALSSCYDPKYFSHSFRKNNNKTFHFLSGGFSTWLEIQGALYLTLGGKLKLVASW
jgi:hypothetical protein